MAEYSIIVAADENNGIGINNKLPWHISDDLKYFKRLTKDKVVLMGRKTWESLPVKPLPNRINIVLTHNKDYVAQGAQMINSIDEALRHCQQYDEIFVMGGVEIYKQFLSHAHKIYITRIHSTFLVDAYFPDIETDDWNLISKQHHPKNENNVYGYSFLTYEKK